MFIAVAAAATPSANGQSLVLLGVDQSRYPLMSASFFALDANGMIDTPIGAGELRLRENGISRTILDVSCPIEVEASPISAVLTMDVSGSMSAGGLDLAKRAAQAWIDAFPWNTSECALTTFTASNQLVQDFTNDRRLLENGIAGLSSGGGTSFDAALIREFAGAIPIVARGKHRRIIVLLTDGAAHGNEAQIIAEAQRIGATVFCVTLDSRMPDILRNIANATGGMYFENVTTAEEAEKIYQAILGFSLRLSPCTVTWESGGCDLIRDVRLERTLPASTARTTYTIGAAQLPTLDVFPGRIFHFGDVTPGSTVSEPLTLTAKNQHVEVRSVTVHDADFVISDFGGSSPPFTLQPGESRVLTVSYTARDSSYVTCKVELETNACNNRFYVTGGSPGRGTDRRVIKLLHPNGGELFVAGADTLITWEGVAPTDPVMLEYSTDAGMTWKVIANSVTGLSYLWRVPNTPSDLCLVRVSARAFVHIASGLVLIPEGAFYMGDNTGSGTADERPSHHVSLTRPFYLGKTEVTQSEWTAVMAENPSSEPGQDFPVDRVTLRDIVEFCNRLSAQEGLTPCYTIGPLTITLDPYANGYRLPTEYEWEYACRAGNSEDFHSGLMTSPYCSPVDMNLDPVGWYCGNVSGLSQVAKRLPNAFGLHDMHGNVAEFCWSTGGSYRPGSLSDPPSPSALSFASGNVIVRGGSWKSAATECRSAFRQQQSTALGTTGVGFRLARNY